MKLIVYHGTPITPNNAFDTLMSDRGACVSFFRPDQIDQAERSCPHLMLDNGAFSFWMAAIRAGLEADETLRDWRPFYKWVENRQTIGRWAVIPDAIGMPSQVNDGLINEWPFGQFGAPVWHMNGPISRLGLLCEKWERVCLGWVGETRADNRVGSDAYRRRMDEVSSFLGNDWHNLHMMRGVTVVRDYPFRIGRQHKPCPKRLAIRSHGRPWFVRQMGWAPMVCRPLRRKAQ